jgi:ABC-2 type transport system ATP-binding protein
MLKINNLTKGFGQNKVLKSLSFTITKGINCIIGPNGSGKTTLLNSIVGLYAYTGEIFINEVVINSLSEQKLINFSYVPDIDSIDYYITGREYLTYLLKIKENLNDTTINKIESYISLFGLERYIDELVCNYSHGTIKKLTIIGGLVSSPELLILDEPFNGLDPEYSIILQAILKELTKLNIYIILSSHDLSIVKKLANNLIIIKDGELFYEGSLYNFIKHDNLEKKFLELSGNKNTLEYVKDLAKFY